MYQYDVEGLFDFWMFVFGEDERNDFQFKINYKEMGYKPATVDFGGWYKRKSQVDQNGKLLSPSHIPNLNSKTVVSPDRR